MHGIYIVGFLMVVNGKMMKNPEISRTVITPSRLGRVSDSRPQAAAKARM